MLSARLVRRATWLLLTIGALGARLIAAPDGTAMPTATVGRACAYQDASADQASTSELRSAVVCLMNRARGRWHLPALREHPRLDHAAQEHTDQMVAHRFFGHYGADGSDPATRLDRAGFRWSALGEDISTGYRTPRDAVAGWLASTAHCRILLSPSYRDLGIGVNRRPVRGYANIPGTWTADFALPTGSSPPGGNSGPAKGCPY
jgi:uncharacterized protein YkwD